MFDGEAGVGKPSVLLVGHGSPDPAARAELRELREMVAARLASPVAMGVLEFSGPDLPSLDQALATLDPEREVVAQPLLLFDGLHGREDLPALAEKAASEYGLRARMGTSFGRDRALEDLVLGRLRGLGPGPGDRLLFVGRGSSEATARGQAEGLAAAVAAGCGLDHDVCYTGISHPLLDEGVELALASFPRRILVVPYLIHTGVLLRRVHEVMPPIAARAGCGLEVLPHLGNAPELVDLVSRRIDRMLERSEARAGVSIPTLVVGAAQSGAGKTTTTLALIAGLRRRGLRVQPFKVGPDYLDPSLLSWAADRQCRNLDGWMIPAEHLLELFHRACRGADVAVVEGVMGLFDGKSGSGDLASTASIARLLDASVLLVLDAARASRTVGAVALGLARADSRLQVEGALLNRISSDRHLETCTEGLAALGIPLLGHLARQADLALPERYLGLVSPAENAPSPQLRESLERASAHLDLDAILQRARPAAAAGESLLFPARPQPRRARIAYALDQAFHFYYRDSLDLIEAWGGELVPFSPLTDEAVPSRSAIYLGGGYPELFAGQLTANAPLRESIRQAHARGALVYAECGGAMYASSGIETVDGDRHDMVGLWPTWVSLARRRLTVGYRQVRSRSPHFLAGWELPVHEFHYSQLRDDGAPSPAWLVLGGEQRPEGCSAPGLVASYIHLHLASRPGLAGAFVEACQLPK